MATEIWINIGLGNGLLPDGTKPLPEQMLTDHQRSSVTFISGHFHKRCLNHQSLNSVWKFQPNFPGANELKEVHIYLPWLMGSWIVACINRAVYSNTVINKAMLGGFSNNFDLSFICFESLWYLTGVTIAELWRYLSNISVIFNR